jgi:Zn-dependent M28 family amino/carboxypeptidase
VVGAHYDAYGGLPGADDNASGVAGAIELARLLGASPPPIRVDVVAFTLEEPPAFGSPGMGSAVHAASLRRAGVRLRAMVCLEMIGYYSNRSGSQTFPMPILRLFYPGRGNFIAIVGRPSEVRLVRILKGAMRSASTQPVRSINGPRSLLGADLSDHASYWDAGYPAVMVTDTAFYRNLAYHTAADSPETLDYDRIAEVVRGVFAAVLRLAKD